MSSTTASPWRDEIEAWLNDVGVTWKRMPALSMAAIDKQHSLSNQARVEDPLLQDQVLIFATAMNTEGEVA